MQTFKMRRSELRASAPSRGRRSPAASDAPPLDDLERAVRMAEKPVLPRQRRSVQQHEDRGVSRSRKRVLVVDDSFEFRELGRKLLSYRGYAVEAAVDGLDAWSAVRTGNFDLVLAAIDMPPLDGIRLLELIREDARFEALPVLIVCEKECEGERRRAFLAGADYYVVKGSFHDTLVQTVASLIGPALP